MRRLALAALLGIAVGAWSPPPESPRAILEAVVAHAESASLYRDRVRWSETRRELLRLADTAHTVPELAPAIRYLLRQLGDEHGRVFYRNRPIASCSTPPKPHQAGLDDALYTSIQYATDRPFRTALLPRGVGYVRIVGLPMGDNTAMAKRIDDAVCDVVRQGATRWIVDLRYNGGGNLNPMAEGIAAIIGDGAVGGWKGQTPAEDGAWKITAGDFDNHGYSVHLPNGCRVNPTARVAVLTSVYTASSGEALAVMFKGRPNTRSFGAKTLGMVTVTDWMQIDSTTAMTISVGTYRDRTGRVCGEFVEPDEVVVFRPTEALESDDAIRRASEWLLGGRG
jgi:carboxyl-terminal processing protease